MYQHGYDESGDIWDWRLAETMHAARRSSRPTSST